MCVVCGGDGEDVVKMWRRFLGCGGCGEDVEDVEDVVRMW